MDHLFKRRLLRGVVVLTPRQVGSDYKEVVQEQLRASVEGLCTKHGYVMRNSVSVDAVTGGAIEGACLNGYVRFDVAYFANVCQPEVGSVFTAIVRNFNRFGVEAQGGLSSPDGTFCAVASVMIMKALAGEVKSEVDLDEIKVGDTLTVQVLSKKFELNDDRVMIIGRAVAPVAAAQRSGAGPRAPAKLRARRDAAAARAQLGMLPSDGVDGADGAEGVDGAEGADGVEDAEDDAGSVGDSEDDGVSSDGEGGDDNGEGDGEGEGKSEEDDDEDGADEEADNDDDIDDLDEEVNVDEEDDEDAVSTEAVDEEDDTADSIVDSVDDLASDDGSVAESVGSDAGSDGPTKKRGAPAKRA